jgi:hypothetical protein
MKRKLWRNKNGQIQGVDFALAMTIFMIMFAEVIVLSLAFIEPKFQNVDNQTFQTRAEQISNAFFSSSGYPEDWEYNFPSDYQSIGLRKIDSTELDANKISRINSKGLYNIDYSSVKNNLSREQDFGFQLSISSLFTVDTTLNMVQPTGSVSVTTSVPECTIWMFIIAPNSSIIFTQRTQTNSSGLFSIDFATGTGGLPDGIYSLVTFAESNINHFAVDYTEYIIGSPEDLGLQMLVQETKGNNGQVTIQTKSDVSLSELTATILYPYPQGEETFGNETIAINSPSNFETLTLRVPTNGTSVTLLTGNTALGGFSRTFFVYPSSLIDSFETVFGESNVPISIDVVKIEEVVVVRGCIFKAVLYIWSE